MRYAEFIESVMPGVMKEIKLMNFFDQKKLVSHTAIVALSLVLTLILAISGRFIDKPFDAVFVFLILTGQIEVFIFLGGLLFVKLNYDRNPIEVTRDVAGRLLVFLSACLLASMILFIGMKYIVGSLAGKDLSRVVPDFFEYDIKDWFKSTIKGLLLGSIIFIVLLWQTSLRREQKLREQNLIFQNETLRSQVNPHFLFNSLNTISSLINTNPEAAETFINNLSSVYRYILENSRKDMVPLQSEIEFVTNYLNLHKIRDDDKIILEITANSADQYKILPVSLQILAENAIKHNIATRETPLIIKITSQDDLIVVSNTLRKKASQLMNTGIGLRNLDERVKLTTGKNLIISESDESFTVKIPLLKDEYINS